MNKEFSKKFPELDEFLCCLSNNISSAINRNDINKEYFNTKKHNKKNVAHKSICKIISNTGDELGYLPYKNHWFRFKDGKHIIPDIRLWKDDDLIFLIEYESTNSSDSRVIEDMYRYGRAVAGETSEVMPRYWLVIYTLPDEPVSDWPTYDYRKTYMGRPNWVFGLVTKNPKAFYKRAYKEPSYFSQVGFPERNPNIAEYPGISKYTENEQWNDRKIFLVNLTVNGLEIDFPEQFNRPYLFKARTG